MIDSFVGHTPSLATGGLASWAVDNYPSLLRHLPTQAHGMEDFGARDGEGESRGGR